VQFLADIGFLDDRTLLGHGVFTTAHPWPTIPLGTTCVYWPRRALRWVIAHTSTPSWPLPYTPFSATSTLG
jgi:hypothetical protein